MNNQRGITLVELLAVLAIAGIITTLIISVLANGSNASQRTTSKQQLQQEANIIVEKIRAHYLLNEKEATIPDQFLIIVDKEKLFIRDVEGVSVEILLSEGFDYDLNPIADPLKNNKETLIDRTENSIFNLLIKPKDSDSNTLVFEVKTSFSKLN